MKVTVVKEFRDLYDFTRKYEVGTKYEFSGERLQKLLALGLVKVEGQKAQESVTEKPKRKYTKRID